jgi:hypothetical protein
MFEFPWARSLFTKRKFSLAFAVENQHPIVYPIDHIDIPFGTNRDIAGLISGGVYVEQESTVNAICGVRVVGKEEKEKTYNNTSRSESYCSHKRVIRNQ